MTSERRSLYWMGKGEGRGGSAVWANQNVQIPICSICLIIHNPILLRLFKYIVEKKNSHMEKIDPNSPDLELEQIYVYLTLGSRTPQNEDEKKLLKEIKRIKKQGYTVEIPFNGL